MEKLKCFVDSRYKTQNPSFQLYQHSLEYAEKEQNTQRFGDNDSVTGWQTPDEQLQLPPVKKKKNKRGQESNSEKRMIPLYHDGAWDKSVEKYSYRYVPNNGCYRALKTQVGQPKSYSVQRRHSPTTGLILSTEQRLIQREISKDLRQQFQALLENNRTHLKINKTTSGLGDEYLEEERSYNNVQNNTSKQPAPTPVQPTVVYTPMCERILETQSAQPAVPVNKLEDLLINKRCITNIDNKPPHSTPRETSLIPPDKSWVKGEKSQSRSVPLIPAHFNRIHMASTDEVEALAMKTFTNRKGPIEPLRASRSLGPLEKVTPALREAYDNSKAVQEIMKFDEYISTKPVAISVNPITSDRRRSEGNELYAAVKRKMVAPVKGTASLGPGVTSNFRTSKGNETQQKSSSLHEMMTIDMDNNNTTFPAFLPSISGKRITTKISSLR